MSSERPEHPFVRRLRRALVEDVQPELELALRVGAMQALGYSRVQITERLGASRIDMLRALERLERVERARREGGSETAPPVREAGGRSAGAPRSAASDGPAVEWAAGTARPAAPESGPERTG